MKLKRFVFNMFGENTYILWASDNNAAIIDPGMMTAYENEEIYNFIIDNNLHLTHLINTHMHVDHVAGDAFIEQTFNLKPECNIADNYLADRVRQQAEMFGIPYSGSDIKIGKNISDGDIIHIGEESLIALQVPGHTKGHIALYNPTDKFVISGDVLFRMSIGRTDLPGGDFGTLISSIENKLLTLPDDTTVYPGHGDSTTIGFEKKNNPFL